MDFRGRDYPRKLGQNLLLNRMMTTTLPSSPALALKKVALYSVDVEVPSDAEYFGAIRRV